MPSPAGFSNIAAMRRPSLFLPAIALPVCVCVCVCMGACLASVARGEEDDGSTRLGVEVVTGYRSEYVYRGFKLADDVIDAQIEAEIALSNEWVLHLGASYATATGKGDFSETSGYLDLLYETPKWTAGIAATFHTDDGSLFRDGLDLAPTFAWHLSEDLDLKFGVAYDTGAEGWYGHLEAEWSKPLNKSSFITALAGTSVVHDYYGAEGWHDLYARLSYSYAINSHVAVTPFIGASLPVRSGPTEESLHVGLWFEVNF